MRVGIMLAISPAVRGTNRRLPSDSLQSCDDRVARHTFVLGDLAEDWTKRAEPEGLVVRDRNPLVSRVGGLQNHVTAKRTR